MPKSKWLVIAKNEFKLQTAFIRNYRNILPLAALFFILSFQLILAPSILNSAADGFMKLFMGKAAVALMQIILFTISLYIFIFPITSSLKDIKLGQVEIIFSAPVKPKDLLVGEFVGKIPTYAFVIAIFASIFTTVIQPLGLDITQIIVINIVFSITILLAFWLGTLTATILKSRLGKSEKGKELGKSLGFILAIPIVAILYAAVGGILEGLTNPEINQIVDQILFAFPSSWGAKVIVILAQNPSNIIESLSQSGLYLSGLLIFFVGCLGFGGTIADRLYDLEPVSFGSSTIKPDGYFFKTIRAIGRASNTNTLMVLLFKDYSRRFENLTKLGYVIGVLIMMNVLIIKPEGLNDAMMPLMLITPMLTGFVASDTTLRGKECLFIYRKAPKGIKKFVKSKLFQSLMVVLPITLILSFLLFTTFPSLTINEIPIRLIYIGLQVSGNMIFALGIFLWNPVFPDNQTAQMINFQPIIFTNIISWILLRIFLRAPFSNLDTNIFEYVVMVAHLGITWILGIFTLTIGRRKLIKLE